MNNGYTLEEAREAYATDKITLDEYKFAIDRAIEAAKPQPRFRLRLPDRRPQRSRTLTRYQRQRRTWLFWWPILSAVVWLAALLISAAKEIADHHSVVHGAIMTSLITFATCLLVGILGLFCASVDWD